MFASRLRPIARTAARRAYATASSSAPRAAPAAARAGAQHGCCGISQDALHLLYIGAAAGALFTAGSIVSHLRHNNVAPSPEKDDDDEEEVEDAGEPAEEEAEEPAQKEEEQAISKKAEVLIESAIAGLATSAGEVDDALTELVAATEAALAKYNRDTETAAEEATTLPDPAEAASQGAFNEETGEINWDCPCLGGMAHGPCGEQFKAAFSCFVYSEAEPKGLDCVEKFQAMQDCFREHPDVYGDEIDDDEAPAATETPKESTPATTA